MAHKSLDVWKDSIELVKNVYRITNKFPKEEMFGMTSQIRRAAVSVPSNVAEVCARNSDKELIQFLYVSLGSLAELETQLIISNELGYIDKELSLIDDINRIKKMILGLIKYLRSKK